VEGEVVNMVLMLACACEEGGVSACMTQRLGHAHGAHRSAV